MAIDLTRNDILKDKNIKVTVLGAGATGSFIVEHLVALGITDIMVYDDDIIEPHNVTNQNYGNNLIGKTKVEALYLTMKSRYDVEIDYSCSTDDNVEGSDVVFCCVDSYEGKFKHLSNFDGIYIETGISVNTWKVIASTQYTKYISKYRNVPTEEEFNTPLEGEPTSPCGSRLTVRYNVYTCVGNAIKIFIDIINGDRDSAYMLFNGTYSEPLLDLK